MLEKHAKKNKKQTNEPNQTKTKTTHLAKCNPVNSMSNHYDNDNLSGKPYM